MKNVSPISLYSFIQNARRIKKLSLYWYHNHNLLSLRQPGFRTCLEKMVCGEKSISLSGFLRKFEANSEPI